ncbi:MAG: hypothetical protein M3N05_06390 [Pseudomonadota bacterium]|nr:hypothetical protein [Pseudomonadota bacterium]
MKLRRNIAWSVLNILVAVVFLGWSSNTWVEPELRNEHVATGGTGFVFALICLWVVGPIALVDSVWLALTLRQGKRTNNWRPLFVVGSTAVIWIGVISFSASKVG